MGEALGGYARWHSPHDPQPYSDKVLNWLLDQVENGEYILVYTGSGWTNPMKSVLRWSTEDNSRGFHVPRPGDKATDYPKGRWKAAPGLPMMMRLRIDDCLEEARRSGKGECGRPEREWWGGLLEGKRWRGGAAGSEADVAKPADTTASSRGGISFKESRMLEQQDPARNVGVGANKWTIADLLKQLCPKNKAVVDDLANTDVRIADEIFHDDQYYNGKNWTTKRFPAGGGWTGEQLRMTNQGSAKDAAKTAYHELIHKHQPETMMPREAEIDAYYRTEEWAMKNNLPAHDSSFRTKQPDGNERINRQAIANYVDKFYPIQEDEGESPIKEILPSGDVELWDGTVRPPKNGDVIWGSAIMKNPRDIPRSVWKCNK